MARPTHSGDWHANSFQDAAWWRENAKRWDQLADAADADGDSDHATRARREASQSRQVARLKSMDKSDG